MSPTFVFSCCSRSAGANAALQATLITDLLYAANLTRSGGMYPTRWNLVTGGPYDGKTSVASHANVQHTTPM